MKKKIAQAAAGLAVLGIAAASQSAPAQAAGANCHHAHRTINQRQTHQQARIFQGVHNDSLTNREATHLEAREANIARIEARDRASGGTFTAQERRNIQHRENRTSEAIYDQKHDAQHR